MISVTLNGKRFNIQEQEKITPAAVALRRHVGNLLAPGKVPPALIQMNAGQLDQVLCFLATPAARHLSGNFLAMNCQAFYGAMEETRRLYAESCMVEGYTEDEALEIVPPSFGWH